MLLSADSAAAAEAVHFDWAAPLSATQVVYQEPVAGQSPTDTGTDLFDGIESEALPDTYVAPAAQKQSIGKQGVTSLPDLVVSNVTVNSTDWAHSFQVQVTVTNNGSDAVPAGSLIQNWVAISPSATYDPQNVIYSTQYGHGQDTMYTVPDGGLGAVIGPHGLAHSL